MTNYKFVILLSACALLVASTSAVSVSINCGSETPYTDVNSITWVGDEPYVKSGENHVVQNPVNYNRVMNTLRAFTTNKKNCYSIKVNEGDRVFVRAYFRYHNYDKKNNFPSFDLLFNGNIWGHVTGDGNDSFIKEIIYTVKGDIVSICLAQIYPDQFPFISALIMRTLNADMYASVKPNFPLFMENRIAFGLNESIRFPDDEYDRVWWTQEEIEGLNKFFNDASFISDDPDHPPKLVLQSGVIAVNLSTYISLDLDLPYKRLSVYIITYYSEVIKLNPTQKRSFKMYIGDNATTESPIIPPYGSALKMVTFATNVSRGISCVVKPTNDSTLPPLINGLEVYSIGDELTNGTNAKDVDALILLQNSFDQLQESTGDPCLPYPYTWDWVVCNFDPRPRVTALYLNGLGLSGTLPNFSGLDALQKIFLQNNSFAEEIPEFLGSFPKLRELNLANNNFSGEIPVSISKRKDLKFNILGNPHIVGLPTATPPTAILTPGTPPPPFSASNAKTKTLVSTFLGAILPTSCFIIALLEL